MYREFVDSREPFLSVVDTDDWDEYCLWLDGKLFDDDIEYYI